MKILCINIDNTINEIDLIEFKSINCLNNITDTKGYDKMKKYIHGHMMIIILKYMDGY